MTNHVREGIGAKAAQVLLALVLTGAALLISEFSARQLEVESTAPASTQASHLAER
jgi:hypothetical protein